MRSLQLVTPTTETLQVVVTAERIRGCQHPTERCPPQHCPPERSHPDRCHPEAHALCGPKDLCNPRPERH